MSIHDYVTSPWKNSHSAYSSSPMALSPAPEYANSEVLLASLYRVIGYSEVSEKDVPRIGRDVEKFIQKYRDKGTAPVNSLVSADAWFGILHGALESPKLPNQSSKRFLQVTPLIPTFAKFSSSARLAGNPWVPGNLIRNMIWFGSTSTSEAKELWSNLFDVLSIGANDDVFARWLDSESAKWTPDNARWELVEPNADLFTFAGSQDANSINFPAKQFVEDLRSVISIKDCVTRRQWVTILESVIRIAAVSHVLWLCTVQANIWDVVRSAIYDGRENPLEINEIFPKQYEFMSYGGRSLPALQDVFSRYLSARIGINLTLWWLEDQGVTPPNSLADASSINKLLELIKDIRSESNVAYLKDEYLNLQDKEARVLSCKRGIGSNLIEFARHVICQRQAASDVLRGYDQSYFFRKKSSNKNSPWVVSLGPVSLLSIVHCALTGVNGASSIYRLSEHLSFYGIVTDRHDIGRNELGQTLRMLGLVLDSPDAESGMLLLQPFKSIKQGLI